MNLTSLAVGATLPALSLPPVTRGSLALYAGASGDHNPMHIDLDFARGTGASDVFAHGMLVMAFLGRMLTDAVGPQALRSWSVRFVAITPVGAELTCTAVVSAIAQVDGNRHATLDLTVKDQQGKSRLEGTAVVSL